MSDRRVLVVGSGGREHALAFALAASGRAIVDSAPGNPGMAEVGRIWPIAAEDAAGLSELVTRESYDLVVIGSEVPLAAGLADRLRETGAAVFGPGAAAARLEGDKAFAKEFFRSEGIPTADFETVTDVAAAEAVLARWGAPVVVKAAGLAAGKGVTVAETLAEAREAVARCLDTADFGDAGSTVVLEKKLSGDEASVFVLTDGERYHLLPGSQDHKRAFDGDRGPNTGGMGAYSPAPVLTPAVLERVRREIVDPTLRGLRSRRLSYRGVIFVGLMIEEGIPRVLEYNVRFGDPETQAVLPRLGYDLVSLLLETARGDLRVEPLPAPVHPAGACVVIAAGDYPRSGSRGETIEGIEAARARGALVFHAGTAMNEGRLVTAGGRVLNSVGVGETVAEAIRIAYAGVQEISFPGARCRRDIGARAGTAFRE